MPHPNRPVRKQLAGFRIFSTDVSPQPRILERIEAAIMNNLYQHPLPFCDIPDRGMHLEPRRISENRIIAKNKCPVILRGLPTYLEI